jgi:hypothetical protein
LMLFSYLGQQTRPFNNLADRIVQARLLHPYTKWSLLS